MKLSLITEAFMNKNVSIVTNAITDILCSYMRTNRRNIRLWVANQVYYKINANYKELLSKWYKNGGNLPFENFIINELSLVEQFRKIYLHITSLSVKSKGVFTEMDWDTAYEYACGQDDIDDMCSS